MNLKILSFCCLLLLWLTTASIAFSFTPQNGDLYFQQLPSSEFTDAIASVTQGYCGLSLTHVGIFVYKDHKPYVIEAYDKVSLTSLNKFLERSLNAEGKPKVIVGRLNAAYIKLIPKALKRAEKCIGLPYNFTFDIHNENAFYCSQLIYYAFISHKTGKSIFSLAPMTFKNPETGNLYPGWISYFKKLKVAIPQGKLGINPGDISNSKALSIMYSYGGLKI